MEKRTLFSDIYGIHRSIFSNDSPTTRRTEAASQTLRTMNSFHSNRLFSQVWNNPDITFFETAESLRRRKYGGYRKYMPHAKDDLHNGEVDDLQELVPNTQHLRTTGAWMIDNPLTGLTYGIAAGIILPEIMETKDLWANLEILLKGSEAGLALGMIGNLFARNRNHIWKREDFENARVWDTTQYLDMIVGITRKNPAHLEILDKLTYTAPHYKHLTENQIALAYKNLESNPFIRSIGINIGFTWDSEFSSSGILLPTI